MARALSNPVRVASPQQGVDGRGILSKARAPLMTDARIGDFWIDTAAGKLYGPKNAAEWPDNGLIKGDRGWLPVLAAAADGVRRVLKVADWTGGEGAKPTDQGYLGAAGIVADIASAIDFRGPEGPQALINALADKGAVSYSSLVALGEAADDNKKAGIGRLFEPGGSLAFPSLASAQAATIAAAFGRAVIAGRKYARVASEPALPMKFRSTDRFLPDGNTDSANGGWWLLDEAFALETETGGDGVSARTYMQARARREAWRWTDRQQRKDRAAAPIVYAHRGMGASSSPSVQSTLHAYSILNHREVRNWETDLCVTSDGKIVLFHDPSEVSGLMRDVSGPVASYTLAQIQAMRFIQTQGTDLDGLYIPSLDEFLDLALVYRPVSIHMELKNVPDVSVVLNSMQARNYSRRITLYGPGLATLQAIRALDLDVGLMLTYQASTAASSVLGQLDGLSKLGNASALVYYQDVLDDPTWVSACHDRDISLITFETNHARLARQLYGLGIDGHYIDRPSFIVHN